MNTVSGLKHFRHVFQQIPRFDTHGLNQCQWKQTFSAGAVAVKVWTGNFVLAGTWQGAVDSIKTWGTADGTVITLNTNTTPRQINNWPGLRQKVWEYISTSASGWTKTTSDWKKSHNYSTFGKCSKKVPPSDNKHCSSTDSQQVEDTHANSAQFVKMCCYTHTHTPCADISWPTSEFCTCSSHFSWSQQMCGVGSSQPVSRFCCCSCPDPTGDPNMCAGE